MDIKIYKTCIPYLCLLNRTRRNNTLVAVSTTSSRHHSPIKDPELVTKIISMFNVLALITVLWFMLENVLYLKNIY